MKVQQGHFMRQVGEKEARFICAWALCRRSRCPLGVELSVSVGKEALPFYRHQDETGG